MNRFRLNFKFLNRINFFMRLKYFYLDQKKKENYRHAISHPEWSSRLIFTMERKKHGKNNFSSEPRVYILFLKTSKTRVEMFYLSRNESSIFLVFKDEVTYIRSRGDSDFYDTSTRKKSFYWKYLSRPSFQCQWQSE